MLDCAEEFDVYGADKVEPGTVMVLGNEGALSASQQAYDKRVAGVISGAGTYKPGIVLDKKADITATGSPSPDGQSLLQGGRAVWGDRSRRSAHDFSHARSRDGNKRPIQGIRRGDRQSFATPHQRPGIDSNLDRPAITV